LTTTIDLACRPMAARVKSSGVPAMPLMSRTVQAKSTATPPHSRRQARRGITGTLQGASPDVPEPFSSVTAQERLHRPRSVRFPSLRFEFRTGSLPARPPAAVPSCPLRGL
jgi:hypothetical protein